MNKELKKQIANKGYTDEQVAAMVAMYDESVTQAEEQSAEQTEEIDQQEGEDANNTPEVVKKEVSETVEEDEEITVKKSDLNKMVKDMVAISLKGTPNTKPKPKNIPGVHIVDDLYGWGEI